MNHTFSQYEDEDYEMEYEPCCEGLGEDFSHCDFEFNEKMLDDIKSPEDYIKLKKRVNQKYEKDCLIASRRTQKRFDKALKNFILTKIASGEICLRDSFFKVTRVYFDNSILYVHIKDVEFENTKLIYTVSDVFKVANDEKLSLESIRFDHKQTFTLDQLMFFEPLTKEEFNQAIAQKAIDCINAVFENKN